MSRRSTSGKGKSVLRKQVEGEGDVRVNRFEPVKPNSVEPPTMSLDHPPSTPRRCVGCSVSCRVSSFASSGCRGLLVLTHRTDTYQWVCLDHPGLGETGSSKTVEGGRRSDDKTL